MPFNEKKYVQSDAVTQAQQALTQQQVNKPGSYQSQFQTGLNDLSGQIQNRPKFQYDVNADALYQQVAQNYMNQGQQAMMDTMGQAAALTGGYGNSYAQTAGQQQYNNHLLGLTNMVPQFQQMALQQYQLEGDQLMDQYNLMMQQEEMAYGRYQDNLNRYYADLDRMQAAYDNERDFDYGKYQDDLNYQYQQERDRIQDEQWQKEFDEAVRQFNEELALKKPKARGSSGGGGGGGSQVSASDQAAMDYVDRMLDNATGSNFDPGRVIDGTNALTDEQKEVAQNYLNGLLNAGYMK